MFPASFYAALIARIDVSNSCAVVFLYLAYIISFACLRQLSQTNVCFNTLSASLGANLRFT
jgi:hypothetical protein